VKTTWTTVDGDPVGVGDRVAISSLLHPDVVGEIIGPLLGDRIECHVTQTAKGPANFHLPVYEHQLICRMPTEETLMTVLDRTHDPHPVRRDRLRKGGEPRGTTT
jgi:hypothetical protein